MAKPKTEIQEISPVFNPALDDRGAYPNLNAGESAVEVEEGYTDRPLQPLRRTIVSGQTPDNPTEPDTYEKPPASAAPATAKRDAVQKSGFTSFTSPSAAEAILSDEKWSLVRPNRTQVCIIGPRRWYFEKDVQLSVPESVKQVLARASMIYPG